MPIKDRIFRTAPPPIRNLQQFTACRHRGCLRARGRGTATFFILFLVVLGPGGGNRPKLKKNIFFLLTIILETGYFFVNDRSAIYTYIRTCIFLYVHIYILKNSNFNNASGGLGVQEFKFNVKNLYKLSTVTIPIKCKQGVLPLISRP